MKVLDVLNEGNWGKGSEYGRAPYTLCLAQAIREVYRDEEKVSQIYNKVERYLGRFPTHWNDAPERTFADVKALVEELGI
jgi:hypothetical protein